MIASMLGVLGVLALVLGLLVLTMRYLKRFAPNGGAGLGKVPLEVVQRLALSPKQGIAIVRIGERFVAISMGDGGVRALAELDAGPTSLGAPFSASGAASGAPWRGTAHAATASPVSPVVASTLPSDFRNLLRTALRGSTTLALLAAVLLPAGLMPAAAHAQRPAARSAAPGRQATAPAARARPGSGAGVAKSSPAGTATAGTATAGTAVASADAERADQMISRVAPTIDLRVAGGDGLRLSGTVGVVVMMGLLTLLPTLVLMMTGFTRILVVLHFLRQAIGTQSAPPAQLIAGLALLITGFVMAPTLSEVNRTALQPWMDGRIEQAQMLSEGVKPFRTFMLRQVRPSDLSTFANISGMPVVGAPQDVPLVVLVSAFVTSEMRTAFQIGFALFLPFIVIDVVVASVLMSMGMMMLPPAMISLPFKLLLFVLVDGWSLIVTGLVQSFH